MSYDTKWHCTVKNCDSPTDHTTYGHECPKCNEFGHGTEECGECCMNHLVHNTHVPKGLRCTQQGCRFNLYHTSAGHRCGFCQQKGHSGVCCKNKTTPNKYDLILQKYVKTLDIPVVKGKAKIFQHLNEGMGCRTYIITDANIGKQYSIYMHSDDWGQYGNAYCRANIVYSLLNGATEVK